MIWMIRCCRWKPQSEYKEDKATTQILNLNTKTIENKNFIHYLKRFPQTVSVCFVMPTSKHKYQCFLILVQSFSACTFSRIYALIVSDTNFRHTFLNDPDKKWKQNSSKRKRHSQKQEAKSVRRSTNCRQPTKLFLALCHKDFALIG